MKIKLLFTIAFIGFLASNIHAQSIPNGNFENWTTLTSEIPQNYVWTSNAQLYSYGLPFNVIKSTDAYHGNYAIKMTSSIGNGDTMPGILLNIIPSGSNSANWHGGFAYNQKPTGIQGYYKSAIALPDTGSAFIFFYKAGVMIGQYGFYFNGSHTNYTKFSINFSSLTQTPDTIIFGASSSNFNNMNHIRNGSMLQLDSISFTGVSSQPTLFNGDFENWQSTIINEPNNWFFQGGGGSNSFFTGGAYKTSDAKAGNSAIELITFLGDRNNHAAASGGQISTGWYPRNCNNNCYQQGGYPFTHQIDTLAFWYKYVPSGNDFANVYLSFKKNHNNIGMGNYGTNLSASATYQYMEIPFNIGQTPDSVIVNMQSSVWEDSLISYVGSDLKIDEMHFKSQPLTTGIMTIAGAENEMNIYPNPTNSQLVVISKLSLVNGTIKLINLTGQTVIEIQNQSGNQFNLDLTAEAKGIYFIEVQQQEINVWRGKVVKE